MSKILNRFADGDEQPLGYLFWCPGCDEAHAVYVEGMARSGARWSFNGDELRPTFTPSLLIQYDRYEPPATTPELRSQILSGEIVQTKVHHVCHSFIRDGQILFLGDCTHALAGQLVAIPEWED